MIRCRDCDHPGVKRDGELWFCLFHPADVRPRIDPYTGNIRRTPEEQKAADLEARRVAAQLARSTKPARKVIRPAGTSTRTIREPDVESIVADYQAGVTIIDLCAKHHHSQRTVRRVLVDAGVHEPRRLPRRVDRHLDVEQIRADYLAGIPCKVIAAKHSIGPDRLRALTADLERPSLAGKRPAPIDEARCIELYATGLGGREVARQLGVSEARVLGVLRAAGVVRSPHRYGLSA